jgi:Protein of unknown function (DUF3309)
LSAAVWAKLLTFSLGMRLSLSLPWQWHSINPPGPQKSLNLVFPCLELFGFVRVVPFPVEGDHHGIWKRRTALATRYAGANLHILALFWHHWREEMVSIGTIILIILIIALLGGFSGIGGGPFYGTGYYGGGGLGLVVVVLIILLLMGRLWSTPEALTEKAPLARGFFFKVKLPSLAIVPVVHFLPYLIFVVAIALLELTFKLVLLAGDHIEIVIRKLTPLLLDLASDLLPISFNSIPVHFCSPLMTRAFSNDAINQLHAAEIVSGAWLLEPDAQGAPANFAPTPLCTRAAPLEAAISRKRSA